MIKLQFCLRRAPHLTREEFQRYWREQHAPLVASFAQVLGVRRYVQRHTVGLPTFEKMGAPRGGVASYDGIAELWWEPVAMSAAELAQAREANRQLLEDEGRFIDLPNSPVFFVDDHEVIPFVDEAARAG